MIESNPAAGAGCGQVTRNTETIQQITENAL
jgi:hypothetical protein